MMMKWRYEIDQIRLLDDCLCHLYCVIFFGYYRKLNFCLDNRNVGLFGLRSFGYLRCFLVWRISRIRTMGKRIMMKEKITIINDTPRDVVLWNKTLVPSQCIWSGVWMDDDSLVEMGDIPELQLFYVSRLPHSIVRVSREINQ